MWRDMLRRLLVLLRAVPRPDLVVRAMHRHPNPQEIADGMVIVVQDGPRQKWACLRCPGGCGEKLQLSLHPSRHPRWTLTVDWLHRPSTTPSVRQLNACRCHFWIEKGMVVWCADSKRGTPQARDRLVTGAE